MACPCEHRVLWHVRAFANLGRSIPYERRLIYYDRLCVRASRDYVPKPYPGYITMFSRAGNSERHRKDWAPLARGGLTVPEVRAEHGDMMLPPHSKLLAEYFDACLGITNADNDAIHLSVKLRHASGPC
jgi:hypothetical protein